jgi:hypothetical protein
LGRIIKICCEGGNVPDVCLAGHSPVFDEDFNSTTVIEPPLLFVVVEYGERRKVNARKQETLYSHITMRDDVRVAVLRGYPFKPEQLGFASREMASREREEDFLIRQRAVDE